jgi:predicted NAD/FAD-dependent oxidoreductase
VHWGTRIEALRREENGWVALGSGDPGAFDAAIVAVPAEQARPLLAPHRQAFADLAAGTNSQPSWTVMAAFSQRLSIEQDIVRNRGAIGWAARDSAKPGRVSLESWVIQANADWSAQHVEQAPETVAPILLGLLASEIGIPLPAPIYLQAHRWRFARSGRSGEPTALWDATIRLGACGDWLAAPRVEAAWLSGRRAAAQIGEAVDVNGSEGR